MVVKNGVVKNGVVKKVVAKNGVVVWQAGVPLYMNMK